MASKGPINAYPKNVETWRALADAGNLQTTEVIVGMIIIFYGAWPSKMLSADSVVGIAITNLAIKLFTT